MVKYIVLFCAALCIASCGGTRFGAGTMDDIDRSADEAASETGDRELTMDEFDALERLKENAIDPGDANLEALLSIPGFPEELARRVVEVAGGARPGGTWIGRLTPPEREELYRYREYIVLPEIHPVRFDGRVMEESISGGAAERREGRLSLTAYGSKALWRGRYSKEGAGSAFYLSARAFSGMVQIHGGSFAPDLAMGLLLGGSSSSYLFSGTYPFHGSRPIAGSTSFSAPAVFGGAAELWYRRVKGVFLIGRPRVFRSTRFDIGKEELFGGRCAILLGAGEVGLSGFSGISGSGRATYGIDGAWCLDAVRTAFELDLTSTVAVGSLWGLSYRMGGTRAGLLLHSIPPGMAGKYGRVNGQALGSQFHHVGATMVVEQAILPGLHVRTALERLNRMSGLEGESRDIMKIECEGKWRRGLLRLSWSSATRERRSIIPYPPASSPALDNTSSLGAYSTIRIANGMVLKLSLRTPRDNDASGLLFSPVLSLSLFSKRFDASASGVLYRAFEGHPVCYYCEPSPRGVYPWRAASSNEKSGSFLINYIFKRLTASCKTRLEDGKHPEVSLQAAIDF